MQMENSNKKSGFYSKLVGFFSNSFASLGSPGTDNEEDVGSVDLIEQALHEARQRRRDSRKEIAAADVRPCNLVYISIAHVPVEHLRIYRYHVSIYSLGVTL